MIKQTIIVRIEISTLISSEGKDQPEENGQACHGSD